MPDLRLMFALSSLALPPTQAATLGVPAHMTTAAMNSNSWGAHISSLQPQEPSPPGRWLGPNGSEGNVCSWYSNMSVCMMGYFCYCVVLGQLHSRVVEPMSCKKIGLKLLAVYIVTSITTSALERNTEKEDDDDNDNAMATYFWASIGMSNSGDILIDIMYTVRNLIFLYYGIKIRKAFRARDQIPETVCHGRDGAEDCLCMWFCSSCNVCMMMNHDLEVQHQEYEPGCCNYTEIGAGHLQQNQPRTTGMGARGVAQPGVMGTVVQAQAADAQQPQVGVVVQGTVVQPKHARGV